MRCIAMVMALCAGVVQAQDIPPEHDCQLNVWWANKAYHISHTIGLEAEKWHIVEDGYPPEVYAVIIKIKHEAYNDLPALRRRVEMACAEKERS